MDSCLPMGLSFSCCLFERFSCALQWIKLSTVLGFIISQLKKGYAPSTIRSRLSAVSFVHNLAGVPDPTQHFIIKKVLLGANRIVGTPDTRLPIVLPILKLLVDSVPQVCQCIYHVKLISAMYLLAFHAFMCPGEIIPTSKNSYHVVQLNDVKFDKK